MTSLDFDQLLDPASLRSAVAEATGRGVHVAILDTGVDTTHPDLQGAVVRSVEVVPWGNGLVCQDVPADRLKPTQLDAVGHGTACTGIIHQLAPEARLISVTSWAGPPAGRASSLSRACSGCWRSVRQDSGRQPEPGHAPRPLRRPAAATGRSGLLDDVVLVAAANNMVVASYPPPSPR